MFMQKAGNEVQILKLSLSTNIKELRKSHNLTQEQLAEAMNVTVGTVSKWESASSSPDIEMIVELADFFHISVDVLLGYQWKGHPWPHRA